MAASTVIQGSVLAFDIVDYSERTPQAQKRAQQLCARVLAVATRDRQISILAEHWLDAGDGGYLILQGDIRGALYVAENFARLLAVENADLAESARVDLRYAMDIGMVERWTDDRGTRTAGDVINDCARLLSGMNRTHKGQAVTSGRYRDALVNQAGVDAALFTRLKDIIDKHGGVHPAWNVRRLPGFGVEPSPDGFYANMPPTWQTPTYRSPVATENPVFFGGRDDFERWLDGRPAAWGKVLAARSALRALAFGLGKVKSQRRVDAFRIWLFRATSISWFACTFPSHEMAAAAAFASAASNAAAFTAADAAAYATASAAAAAAEAVAAASASAAYTAAAYAAADAAAAVAVAAAADAAASWRAISSDCAWLQQAPGSAIESAQALAGRTLWPELTPPAFGVAWAGLRSDLRAADLSWAVWIDWYERRITGSDCGFAVPQAQDLIVQRKFAAADDDFWARPAPAINVDIQGWIDAARDSPDSIPPQDKSATLYGVNADGRIDRLPPAEQTHLRDELEQRLAYADLSVAVANMLSEHGQRLGQSLKGALERLSATLPEDFAAALARPIFRALLLVEAIEAKHIKATQSRDPDPGRLADACAIDLDVVLRFARDLSFFDDGLRAADERTRAPVDVDRAAREMRAAEPVVTAILASPEIATDTAIADLQADSDADVPIDPAGVGLDAVRRDDSNATRRNWIAAWLGEARSQAGRSGARTASDARRGAGEETGKRIVQLVVDNRNALLAYVRDAFPKFDLSAVIEKIIEASQKFL